MLHGFSDCLDPEFYSESLNWAAEQGVIHGNENGYFCLEYRVKLEQFVTYLYNYVCLREDPEVPEGASDIFQDSEDISGEAKTAMDWAADVGIITAGEYDEGCIFPQSELFMDDLRWLVMRYFAYYRKL